MTILNSPNGADSTSALAVVPGSRLRESLLRLDAAARARLLTAGDDVDDLISGVAARIEQRVGRALTHTLRSHAWLALGVAVGVGLCLGRLATRTTNRNTR